MAEIYGNTTTTPIDPDAFGGGTGGNITVDQTYNPESKNAQSGKAVAEALGNIKIYDCATSDSSAYIMDVKTPVKTSEPLIRSIRLLGDGQTLAVNSDNVDNEVYRPWNYGTKNDKVNIEIGSGITKLRDGIFRELKSSINKINFSNAKSNLIIGSRAFAYNDLDCEFELPSTFGIEKYAFNGNPCGVKWKSNYSALVKEPILNDWKNHITQRNEEYKSISYSDSNVYKRGCVLCQVLAILKNLTDAEVTINDLVLLARNNACVVNKFTSNTISNVTVDDSKMLSLSLTGKEATDTETSTVADRKYYNLRFTFTVNADGQTFTAEKYFRDTEQNEVITSSLSVADLNSVYGVSFVGSLTVGDTIIVAVYPYEGKAGGTTTDFIPFATKQYNLSCTTLERPTDLQEHNELLLSELSKDVYIADTTNGHNIAIRGCNSNGDVYVIDPETKTLNQHTQDLQYVFAGSVPTEIDGFPLNTFSVMQKIHYKNLWKPRTDKAGWTTKNGATYRLTTDGIFECYGTVTKTLNMSLYDTANDFTITPNKPYSLFGNGNHLSGDTTKFDIIKSDANNHTGCLVIVPKEGVTSFNSLGLKFIMAVGQNLGTEDNPTIYKCMLVEGDYFDRGLTFFPYEGEV